MQSNNREAIGIGIYLCQQIDILKNQLEQQKIAGAPQSEIDSLTLVIDGLDAAMENVLDGIPTETLIGESGELSARWAKLKAHHGKQVVVKVFGKNIFGIAEDAVRKNLDLGYPSSASITGTLEVNEQRCQARVVVSNDAYVYFDVTDFLQGAEETPEARESDGLPVFLIQFND